MLLAVDIGNSQTKFALFDGTALVSKFSIETHADELVSAIDGRLDGGFNSAIVCSVVSDAGERLERLLKHGFSIEPVWVDHEMALGIEVRHSPPRSLGKDRLVNVFAAGEKYGTPVIVCSLGTATTIDFIDENRVLVGGLISPGAELMAKALHEQTAALPEVTIEAPDGLLGSTTEEAIRSGINLGSLGLIEIAVDRIRDAYGPAQAIATGGLANGIAEHTDRIDVVDPDLTLDGLRLIYDRVNGQKS
jgi:type III pantothenate kinase